MKKLGIICAGALLTALTACNASETGSPVDTDRTETEREGMETNDSENVKTEEDETMERKYQRGSDEDPIEDSLQNN